MTSGQVYCNFMKRTTISILFILLTVKFGLACCAADNRTLTEMLFNGRQGTIFTCKILSTDQNDNGDLYSMVKIIEVLFGLVDSSVVKINSGNYNYLVSGKSLPVGQEYLIYTGGSGRNFGCCVCDRWTKPVSESLSFKKEIETIREFSTIFKQKKSGKFGFFYHNEKPAATGQFRNGKAIETWKHYYENGIIKAEYDLKNNITWQFSKNGFMTAKSTVTKNVGIYEKYSSTVNGQLKFKDIETKNDTGLTMQVYEYFDNGNLKGVHGQIVINVKGGSTSGGKTGIYEVYYSNGNLKLKGQFEKNRRTGVWTWYHENGDYNTDLDYKDGTAPQ